MPNQYSPTRIAWLMVVLLVPVALLNYLDRQMSGMSLIMEDFIAASIWRSR